ncbi:ATP-binding protein [Aquabacterium sp.]|uniref:ATP-binding protein n=1 Tax=Aquabacterium sp. TaxID=1872578 RepID=UPI002CB72FAA|nr:BTAD domain-containing putative transcriptional regulator [Aquabacterium sp.]HSW03829.1 BTAD domain-containing putative transcriptional regulator [Aquabacterium sp.]
MLALDLLGPVVLRRDGAALPLNIRKTQALLVLLALGGRSGRTRIVGLLWPTLDESSARRNLRRELARLREAGADGFVQAEGDSLALAAQVVCDAALFGATFQRGDAAAALALWRGEPAAELVLDGDDGSFADWLAAEQLRLADLRRQALEAAAAQCESTAAWQAAADHLQMLLASDPLQERHHRALIRVLLAAGRREHALAQYQRCKRLLADELGLAPMAETEALLAAARAAPAPGAVPDAAAKAARHAAPDAPPDAAARAPALPLRLPGELPFVGRAAEAERMQRAWSRGQAMLIVGEAGVGKTRLATDFAASQGPYALVRCQSGDRELAFGAFARALRVLAGQPPDPRGLDGWIVAELARLLPELGPAPPPLRAEAERLRFDEACIQAWLALSRGAFDAIVLDDWQLADPASRTLLARVAARRREAGEAGKCGEGGAIELVAWRGAPDDPELLALAEALGAETLVLARLPLAAVYALLRQLSGAADPARFSERLHGATGGHPYFVAETLRDLAERGLLEGDADGHWRTPFDTGTQDDHELPLPASVRDAVLARVRRQGASTIRLLEAAALAGEPFGAAWLASACALSELEALQALEQAASAQLVRVRDKGGYVWAHDLARQALDSALEPTRRRLVHHRLALAAEPLGASAEAARHFEACGEPRRAVAHRLAAGDAARALAALDDAARHWQQGLADDPTPPQAAALLARALEAAQGLGRPAEAETCRRRLEALRAGAALPPAADVEAGHALARYLVRGESAQAALTVLDTLPPPTDDATRLRRLILRMDALQQRGRIDEARALGDEALVIALPAQPERADLLGSLAMLEFSAGRFDAAVERADRFVTASRQRGDGLLIARGLQLRGAFQAERGDVGAAEVDLREAATLAGRFGNRPTQLFALYNLAVTFLQQTRANDALAVAHEGWALCAEQPASEARTMFRALFIDAYFTLGDWGRAWAHVEPAIAEVIAIGQPMSIAGIAMAVLEPMAVLGQWPRAAALLAALDHDALAQSPQAGHPVWLACAVAALLRGDVGEAGTWLQRLGPPAAIENPRVRHRLLLVDAQRRWHDGDSAGALTQLPPDDATGMNDELRLRVLALRCRAGADAAQQARAALDDPRTHATAGLELAQALGGDVLAARLQRLADSLADWPEAQTSLRATWR